MKRLGILGGMGPMAGAYFYERVIAGTAAGCDSEHIPVILWGDPRVPDRTAHLLHRCEDPLPALRAGADALCAMGVSVLAIPCNTAHAYLDALSRGLPCEVLDMPRLTVAALASRGAGRIGILSTSGTVQADLYRIAARERGLDVIYPSLTAREELDAAIYRQKGGGSLPTEVYLRQADRLHALGADRVVLACTEISAAVRGAHPEWVIDALEVLAGAAICACRQGGKEEEEHAVLRAVAG